MASTSDPAMKRATATISRSTVILMRSHLMAWPRRAGSAKVVQAGYVPLTWTSRDPVSGFGNLPTALRPAENGQIAADTPPGSDQQHPVRPKTDAEHPLVMDLIRDLDEVQGGRQFRDRDALLRR